LVYSCGSLWTSIIPCLALRGLASAIASSQSLKAKVVLRECAIALTSGQLLITSVNSLNDRETPEYTASEYITSILGTLHHYDKPTRPSIRVGGEVTSWKPTDLITHVVCLEGGQVPLDEDALKVSWFLYIHVYMPS
jgi:hypothetical protein